MADLGLLTVVGAQKIDGAAGEPISTQIFFTGLVTNRSPFGSYDNRYNRRFLGGRPDQLLSGLNMEISAYGSIIKRPGSSLLTANTFTQPVMNYFSYYTAANTINLLIDGTGQVYSQVLGTPISIYSKSSTVNVMKFTNVGPVVYMCDGYAGANENRKYLTPTSSNTELWGIATPTTACYFGGFFTTNQQWQPNHTYGAFAKICDSNGNTQEADATGGISGATAPTWNQTIGATTTDNTVTWTNDGSQAFIPGLTYQYCYAFKNSTTGHVSTSSTPVTVNTSGLPFPVGVVIDSDGSADTQVDKIEIYRTAAGGSIFYFLAEINNPSGGGGFSYVDLGTPDQNLNIFITAPINDSNNPPPVGLDCPCVYLDRIWGFVGNTLYFSGGPDTLTGNGYEAWPPANYFSFPSNGIRLVPQPFGLLVFTEDGVYLVQGTTTTTFFVTAYIPDIGILSYFALDTLGQSIYCFTTTNQLVQISSQGVNDVGFPIANTIYGVISPASAYVACHTGGSNDTAVYLSDGNSLWYRLNPNQVPEGGPAWSPQAIPSGGLNVLQSVETTPGVWLLVYSQTAVSGGSAGKCFTIYRNLDIFSDYDANTSASSSYASDLTLGSLVLAQPGQLAYVESVSIESLYNTAGSLVVSVLPEAVSGTFNTLANAVNDPPMLPANSSIISNRYYLNQSGSSTAMRHLLINVACATNSTTRNEILTISVYGTMRGKEN